MPNPPSTSITRKDLARGLDTFSPLGNLADGFARRLENVDTNSSGALRTRTGYEGYYGWVPFRVARIEHDGTTIRLQFADSQQLDLSLTKGGPLVVYGRLSSAQSGDFTTTDNATYYGSFEISARALLSPPSGTFVRSAAQHGFSSQHFWTGIAESDDPTDFSYTALFPDELTVDTTSFELEVDYTVTDPATGFLYYRDVTPTAGEVYTTTATAITTTTIVAGTHALDTFNILVKCFDTTINAGKQTEVIPDEVIISTAGAVTINFTTAFTGRIYLVAAPNDQVKTATATVTGGGPTTNTITIAAPPGPFLFFAAYRYNTGSAQFESVLVDDWVYDSDADEITITYVVSGGTGDLVEVYYVTGATVSNTIEIEDSTGTSTTYTDESPQLTVWGIDHAGCYRAEDNPGGHVTHLDSYRRAGEARLVCGLGGNLFKAVSYAEGAETYRFGQGTANFRSRVDGDTLLAPLFHTADPGSVRTRGVTYDASIAENRAVVTAATYVSSGVVDYTLSFTNKTGALAIGGRISTSDYLTVSGMANPEHVGSFQIQSVQSDTATETVIRCANPAATRASLDEAGAAGRAGVFTDTILTEPATNWLAGDTIVCDAIPDLTCLVTSVSGNTVYFNGVTDALNLPDGQRIGVRRTTSLVPIRYAAGNQGFANLVRGDMLTVSGLDRKVRAIAVTATADQYVSLSGDGTTVTVTCGDAHRLNTGDRFVLFDGAAAGEYVVTAVPTSLTFRFAGTYLSGSLWLQGSTIELDETLQITDSSASTTFEVDGRWIPIEAPEAEGDLPAAAYYRHLTANDYDDQPALRSAPINDALFLTNGDDEVLKFDGSNVYRAGLLPWQPALFAQNDTTGSVVIASGPTLAVADKDANARLLMFATSGLKPGDRIYNSTRSLGPWVVVAVNFNAGTSQYEVQVRPQDSLGATAASDTIRKVLVYKYYFRLNAIDANNTIIATAATSSEDMVIDYRASGTIRLRLIGLPAFGPYDYDRIELEVYRTTADGALFHLQSRRLIDFDLRSGYIDVVDGLSDDILAPTANDNRDVVMRALLGTELGTAWEPPPRAKCLTTTASRLVLGNIKSYPQLSLVFKPVTDDPEIGVSGVLNKRLLFRKNAADTATTTNNTDRVAFEFVSDLTPFGVTISAATTTTVTMDWSAPHGLSVGDWIYLYPTSSTAAYAFKWSGWFQVASVPDTDTITVAVNSDGTVGTTTAYYGFIATLPADVPILAQTDNNLNQRDGNPTGFSTNYEAQIAMRLAAAINAHQRISDQGSDAWLMARAGNDFRRGEVLVTCPRVLSTTPELALPAALTDVQVFVQEVLRASSDEISFQTLLFPSRVAISYPNYPEVFDAPFVANPNDSDSVVDINPADGEEVVAVIPFFGESATGGNTSLSQETVIVKERSVYVLNPDTREYKRLDTRGMGGLAGAAVCVTQRGIVFINASGVHRLNRDLSTTNIGKLITGTWLRGLNRDRLTMIHGHHYALGRRVKISVPSTDANWPDQVLVYDYDREALASPGSAGQEAVGAWTLYTNHPARGWCNLGDDAFWASTEGDVFRVRNRGEASDYRDEAAAIPVVIELRADDFDLPGVRKTVLSVTAEVELDQTDLTELAVEVAMNLSRTFESAGSASLDAADVQHQTIVYSLPTRRGNRVQVRVTHETVDECLHLTALIYDVRPIGSKLLREQGDLA